MTDLEQAKAFGQDLDNLIHRYKHEFDLSYNQMVGALEFQKARLIQQAFDYYKDDEQENQT